MKKNFGNKKLLYIIIFIFSAAFIGIGSYMGITAYLDYKAEKNIEDLNLVLANGIDSMVNCNFIFDFDKDKFENNRFFKESEFDLMNESCDLKFNLDYIELNEENCIDIIKQTKEYFLEEYLIIDNLEEKRNKCIDEFLVTKFSTGSLYDIDNDFKSEIKLDFSLDFYTDVGEENSTEYLNNRLGAKKRLKDLIIIKPEIDFSVDDIVLYPKRGILRLPLKTLTEYKISLKNFDTLIGEKTKNEEFVFTTPENKYFGLRILDKVSLYEDNKPPRFQLLEYNTTKTKAKIRICRIPNETYAKIEVFRKNAEVSQVNDFFLNKIDKLENFDCKEKEIDISLLKNIKGKNNINLIKKDFNFDDLIGKVSRSGLYFVQFSDQDDRNYFNKMNYPIFFGIVDSHITMKISKNGEAFFFVNDFKGKPLANQNIKLYLNDFKGIEKQWNSGKRDYDVKHFSAINNNIFSEAIYLGLTGEDGILKINLNDKVSDAFSRTFTETWEYDWNELYKTFFITSASDTNISYVNSTWNSGIAPWNFGYKTTESYYGNIFSNQDEIILNKWGGIEQEYYSHTYTDRLLYLPGEFVNIKSVIRKSIDLSVPKGEKVELKITDSNGKEVHNTEIEINDFGSVSNTYEIKDSAPLGNYNINLFIDGKSISYGGFSVEVFKNPKFKNDILLETEGLNEGLVKIQKEEVIKHDYRDQTTYKGDFKIKGKVFSKYYNGAAVSDSKFEYKVYKQYYYENSYWYDCYYGCYWEPRKEFYTEGKGALDSNGVGNFDVDIEFASNYSDFKYIVEVTVTDKVGDTISGTNSVIAKLPDNYKRYNNELSVAFKSEQKFIKAGKKITIDGGLNVGKW
ncbi:MAG: MG2 domain-containing protein, partial [Candidatus Gracilibacteria bacterium]